MGIRRGFTYYWQIKNFSFTWKGYITSPEITVDILDDTVWSLYLVRPPSENCIACHLIRLAGATDPPTYQLEYELEFLDGDGFSLLTKQFSKTSFPKDCALSDMKNEFISLRKYIYLPGDTLTVICRMWHNPFNLQEEGRCFAVTRLKVEKNSYVGLVENFNYMQPNVKKDVRMRSATGETCFSSVKICLFEDGKICIEITLKDYLHLKECKCRVILLGIENKQLECCKSEFETLTKGMPKPLKFWLSHTRSDLVRLFSEGNFYIQCEMEYCMEIDYNTIEKTEYAIDLSKDQAISILKTMHSESVDDERLNYLKEERLDRLRDDLLAFYENGILCDLEVKTRAESFHTHSLVLRARSYVWQSYFSTNRESKITLDLEPRIVKKLLLFLYSDSLDDLDTDSARCLYSVAIQYEIPTLRHRCTFFLQENLQISNCCDALLLAEKHQDRNMKAIIQDYIHQHDKEIYSSNEWNDLLRSNSLLAAETMSLKFKKKQEKSNKNLRG